MCSAGPREHYLIEHVSGVNVLVLTPGEMLLFSMEGATPISLFVCAVALAGSVRTPLPAQERVWRHSRFTGMTQQNTVHFFTSFPAGTAQRSRSLPGHMRSAASARETAGVCVARRGNDAGTTAAVTDVHSPWSKAINDFSPLP